MCTSFKRSEIWSCCDSLLFLIFRGSCKVKASQITFFASCTEYVGIPCVRTSCVPHFFTWYSKSNATTSSRGCSTPVCQPCWLQDTQKKVEETISCRVHFVIGSVFFALLTQSSQKKLGEKICSLGTQHIGQHQRWRRQQISTTVVCSINDEEIEDVIKHTGLISNQLEKEIHFGIQKGSNVGLGYSYWGGHRFAQTDTQWIKKDWNLKGRTRFRWPNNQQHFW